jgi:hypothetical protein
MKRIKSNVEYEKVQKTVFLMMNHIQRYLFVTNNNLFSFNGSILLATVEILNFVHKIEQAMELGNRLL